MCSVIVEVQKPILTTRNLVSQHTIHSAWRTFIKNMTEVKKSDGYFKPTTYHLLIENTWLPIPWAAFFLAEMAMD